MICTAAQIRIFKKTKKKPADKLLEFIIQLEPLNSKYVNANCISRYQPHKVVKIIYICVFFYFIKYHYKQK